MLSLRSLLPRISLLALVFALLLGSVAQPAAASPANQAEIKVTFTILSVVQGKSVTVQATGYPAYKEFQVSMDKVGNQAKGGLAAGTARTGKDGSFIATIAIPASLKAESRIAIRLDATDRSGWYAYNWFINSSGVSNSPLSPTPVGGSTSVVRSVSIVELEEDGSVTFKASGLPANRTYTVYLDRLSGKGAIIGYRAGKAVSSKSGSVVETVDIPKALKDRRMLAVRLVALDGSGAYVSDWFSNATNDEGPVSGSPYGSSNKIPVISIVEVDEADSVTVKGYDFPARKEFVVRMGKMGTQGVDGIKAGTVKIGKDGTFTATFEIPTKLESRDQIAIRLEAADGSNFYAYNWFENEDTP